MKKPLIFSLLLTCIAPTWSQPEAWTEKQIYAAPDHPADPHLTANTIVTFRALFAPGVIPVQSTYDGILGVDWDRSTRQAKSRPIELPPEIRQMVARLQVNQNSEKEREKTSQASRERYLSKRNAYRYSIDIFPPYLNLYTIFQSFGKAFFIPETDKPLSQFAVTSPVFTSIRIENCALEARNGRLPVFFRHAQKPDEITAYILGLVSVKTGQLQPLGTWKDNRTRNTISGPIAWIDDDHLACISLIRHVTRWAVFEIGTGKMLARGEWDDQKDGSNFVRSFIIRDGVFYGVEADGSKVILLYASPGKSGVFPGGKVAPQVSSMGGGGATPIKVEAMSEWRRVPGVRTHER